MIADSCEALGQCVMQIVRQAFAFANDGIHLPACEAEIEINSKADQQERHQEETDQLPTGPPWRSGQYLHVVDRAREDRKGTVSIAWRRWNGANAANPQCAARRPTVIRLHGKPAANNHRESLH